MKRSRTKSLLFTALTAVLLLGTVELLSRTYTFFHNERRAEIQDSTYRLDHLLIQLTWTEELIAHPYFGFVRKSVAEEIERLKERKFPSGESRPFVVVMTGASVAQILGKHIEKDISQKLKMAIPELQNRNIEFYNFASGGYRQPQQFFLLSYLIGSVDLVINLDGYNDVTDFDGRWLLPREFPMFSNKFFPTNSKGRTYKIAGNLIRKLYLAINELPKQSAVVASSHAYFYFWERAHKILFRGFRNVEDRFEQANGGWDNYSDQFPNYLKAWEKYIRLSFGISKDSGVRFFAFVQPSQYLPDGKPFSESERKAAINQEVEPFNRRNMTELKARVQQLSKAGVPIVSLMNVFQHEQSPVYIDSCCHVNGLGNEILAKAMIESIQKNWR